MGPDPPSKPSWPMEFLRVCMGFLDPDGITSSFLVVMILQAKLPTDTPFPKRMVLKCSPREIWPVGGGERLGREGCFTPEKGWVFWRAGRGPQVEGSFLEKCFPFCLGGWDQKMGVLMVSLGGDLLPTCPFIKDLFRVENESLGDFHNSFSGKPNHPRSKKKRSRLVG